jgi:hypothetical protein
MECLPANGIVLAVRPRGKAIQDLLESLANGDPIAWTVAIGMVAVLVLSPVTAVCWRRFRKKPKAADPAQMVAAWQQQRQLCFLAVVLVLAGFGLGALFAIALDNAAGGVAFMALTFAGMFIGLVMLIVNTGCPACGGSMGRDWNPTFCPKCGVRLKETGPPGAGPQHPPAASGQNADADDQNKPV